MKNLLLLLVAFFFATGTQAQWVNMNQTFNPRCFTATGSYLYTGTPSGVYRSSNNGTNFSRVGYSTLNGTVSALGVNGSRVFAGTNNSGSGGFYYTTDGDTTWTQSFLSSVDNILVTPSYIYVISQALVWRSSNNGVSFVQTSAPYNSRALGANATGSMVYCGGLQGLYSSNNNGSSWTFLNGLDSLIVSDISVYNNANIYLCTNSNGVKQGSIWISTNSGGSWSQKQLFASVGMSYYSLMLQNPYVLVGCDSGVVVSRDNGLNWVNKSEGLNNNMRVVSKLYYANNFVLASASAVLWRRPFTDAVNVRLISSEVPGAYTLHQNYPNPFNPSTTIKYSIVSSIHVDLIVYDVTGREIARLVNENQSPGTYEITWAPSELTSGIYFYKLQAGVYSDTKRMILIK